MSFPEDQSQHTELIGPLQQLWQLNIEGKDAPERDARSQELLRKAGESEERIQQTFKNHIMSLLGQAIVKRTREINQRHRVAADEPVEAKMKDVKDLVQFEILNIMRNSNLR